MIRGGEVVLLENERDEWELSGGKLEPAESPQLCVARQIAEELRLQVEPRAQAAPLVSPVAGFYPSHARGDTASIRRWAMALGESDV